MMSCKSKGVVNDALLLLTEGCIYNTYIYFRFLPVDITHDSDTSGISGLVSRHQC